MSSITIQQKGITAIPADAIVNAANSGLWAGGGVCGVIFDKAGMDELTEPDALYGAYKRSLELCRENDIHSVVFPLISAGIFGYPVYDAWAQAIYACKNFINKNQDYNLDIIFAIPEDEKVKAGNVILQKELAGIKM